MIFLRMNKSSLISTADDTIHIICIIFYNIILYNTDNDWFLIMYSVYKLNKQGHTLVGRCN